MDHPHTIGRYRIVEHLATGGMGDVYRAAPLSLDVDKPIALKVLRPEAQGDPSFRAMFESEARVALALSHANVVHTFEVGEADGQLFLAMEMVDGLDVSRLIRAMRHVFKQAMPLRHALLITIEALKGLDYAHRSTGPDGRALGLVHRDVSPGNILVSCEGEVKLADFGVAQSALRQHSTLAGMIKGKLGYMAPEHLRGDKLDARADVYAMGVVLYEMITGVRAFHVDTPAAIPDILEGRCTPMRELRADLPESIEDIVMCAMAPRREERFQSAAAMGQWLEEAAWELGYVPSAIELGAFVTRVRDVARANRAAEDALKHDREPQTAAARPRSIRPVARA